MVQFLSNLQRIYWPQSQDGAELQVASERACTSFCVLAGITGTVITIVNLPVLPYAAVELAMGQSIALFFLGAPLLMNGRPDFIRRGTIAGLFVALVTALLSLRIGMLISSSNLLWLPAISAFTLILGWRFGLVVTFIASATLIACYIIESANPSPAPPDMAFLFGLVCGAIILFVGSSIYRREMQRAAYQIEAERQRALQADKAKSEFLAMMSHELRTPMNGVIGMLQLLATSNIGRTEQDQAQTALDSAQSLLTILNDILNYSKNEAGGVELHAAPFNPASTMEKVGDLFRPLANAKGISFRVHGLKDLPSSLIGDEEKTRQIVSNLVSNAIKFTDTGGVDITCRYSLGIAGGSPGRFQLDIADTGIGIPHDQQGLVFDRFQQVEASGTRRFSGTGLGLAICRQLVEMMGGTISLTSTPGTGSVFHVDIPCDEDV